jgi:DNA polymerase IV
MILHVDMDAFYASVEERDDPSLRGKPVIVGGTPESRGVVAAANYVVRKFGVHSAMPTAKALKLCPNAIVLRPRMEHYAQISNQIREIFHHYTPVVEPLSLDEAFLDATGSVQLFGSVETIGRAIKTDIRNELNLVASVGVAPKASAH